jgi:hypothetical protein
MSLLEQPSAGMTHKGWFWFCPVYLNLESDPMDVEARANWLEPLFSLAEMCESARLYIGRAVNPDYPMAFMFKVTGEVANLNDKVRA